jgi:cytochrome c oxidase assembly protein subunit 11
MFFNKTECFCFTKQEFESGERREMPVRFVIGTDIPSHIRTVTLSYTFYDVTDKSG